MVLALMACIQEEEEDTTMEEETLSTEVEGAVEVLVALVVLIMLEAHLFTEVPVEQLNKPVAVQPQPVQSPEVEVEQHEMVQVE